MRLLSRRLQGPLALGLYLAAFVLASCASPARPRLQDPATTASSTVAPVTAATPVAPATPIADATPGATAAPASTAVTTGAASAPRPAVPEPQLFDTAWDDRAPFAPGLIKSEQSALQALPGASIYHIDLRLSDDLTRLKGREEVRYTNTEDVALDEVYFRLFPNLADGASKVANVTVNGAPVQPRYELRDSAMAVPMVPPLQPGEQVVIGMDFDVTVPTEPGGNYGTFALRDGILALAHFYPMIAVYDETGWNVEIAPAIGDVVYTDSGYYLVQASVPVGQQMLTSGREIDRQEQGDRQTLTFAAGPVRDFYIVSSDRYDVVSRKVGETTINAYAPSDVQGANKNALDFAVGAVKTYSDLVGAYPFTELDLVGTPTLAGGVEYPGLVVIALSLYDRTDFFFEAVVAHEVGHQWFYSTVGDDQVDEPWLDESLTQYLTLRYYGDAFGKSGYDGFRTYLDDRWHSAEDTKKPIGLPVAAYGEEEYSAIVYGKGPLFFEALANKMGEAQFDTFLKDYYRTFEYGISTTASLKQLAEKHCGCDLTPLFKEWVYPQN